MADQNFMDLASKTASGITGTDYMMLVNNSEAYKALVNDVAEAILGKLTSKSFSGLETTAKNVIGALNELNSKSLESVGTISKGDNILYNSETISNALQKAYGNVKNVSNFSGILYASRVSGSTGTYWTIEGLKSSANNGYIIIRTYGGDITEHRYLLSSGAWNWVS